MLERMMSKLMEEEHKRVKREEICRELYLAEKEHERADEEIKEALEKKRTARELLQEMVKLWLHCSFVTFSPHVEQ
ncbi:hypothetical protein K0M31_006421 [Melipona bicolor]|uniref:Uncharacterized protein n=1 Tax=Melipona bicolor TaxID=60889 RepID=A0AA40KM17_9HYME|nr:hypothetical protein K0M31_006421 [Melipona bicolor]